MVKCVLNLEQGESDENDDSNFEILLHFEAAICSRVTLHSAKRKLL